MDDFDRSNSWICRFVISLPIPSSLHRWLLGVTSIGPLLIDTMPGQLDKSIIVSLGVIELHRCLVLAQKPHR